MKTEPNSAHIDDIRLSYAGHIVGPCKSDILTNYTLSMEIFKSMTMSCWCTKKKQIIKKDMMIFLFGLL